LTPDQKQLLKTWIAAGLWLIVIAIESTQYLSSSYTARILYPILHFLLGLDRARFLIWHHYIRKTGHFVGYFTLSVLLFRAWRATLPLPSIWALRWAGIAFFMSAFVASMDEWHQTYIPSRTGAVSDVILDSTAALIAQIVIFFFLQRRRARKPEEARIAAGSSSHH
jgi:VanZ family protein